MGNPAVGAQAAKPLTVTARRGSRPIRRRNAAKTVPTRNSPPVRGARFWREPL